MKYKRVNFGMFYVVTILSVMFWLVVAAAFAQTTQAVLQPVLTDYKGIKIGMTAEEVRAKLDKKPQSADDSGFYYVFSDKESAQIGLDENKKVRLISVMYSGKDANAPKYEDVFGKDVPATETVGGGVYNLVRYPEAGFWVAYNRTAGDNPLVTVTIQKLRVLK
jgi:hypothetical protein